MAFHKHAAIAATAVGLLFSQTGMSKEKAPDKAAVKRGEYLVTITGCDDCHTPKVFNKEAGMPLPDMSHRLSGHPEGAPDPMSKYAAPDMAVIGPTFTAFSLPFGTVYAPNLTPDKETGLGSWTEEAFIKALRTGRHMGLPNARPILPPMPTQNLAAMTEQDVKAIYAYLQTVPAVKNKVPEPKVPPEVIQGMTEAANKAAAAHAPPAAGKK